MSPEDCGRELPLPGGEGWGEGERSTIRTVQGSTARKNRCGGSVRMGPLKINSAADDAVLVENGLQARKSSDESTTALAPLS